MTHDLTWVVCWRRRGPVLPIVGPPPPVDPVKGKPPVAWYLGYQRGRGGWVWTARPTQARRLSTRADAERARADAGATRTAAVCCVARHTLEQLNTNGKDE